MGKLWQLILCLFILISPSYTWECGDLEVQERCLFIVSTGRAGSTALQMALNQLDNVFIRGENYGTFYHFETIYNNIKQLSNQKFDSDNDKKLFEEFTNQKKPAHFNAFPNSTADCLIKVAFKIMYGYKQFSNSIVGFKEIRFAPWTNIPVINYGQTNHHEIFVKPLELHKQKVIKTQNYRSFEDRLEFLTKLCKRPQIILNLRRNLKGILRSGFFKSKFIVNVTQEDIQKYSDWLLKYSKEHGKDTFVVYFEDMFDRSVNKTVAKKLLKFLDVKQADFSFAGKKFKRT